MLLLLLLVVVLVLVVVVVVVVMVDVLRTVQAVARSAKSVDEFYFCHV